MERSGKLALHWRILIGLVLGAVAGLVARRFLPPGADGAPDPNLKWFSVNIAELVGRVFLNRLKRDMPLQADPTVAYAMAKEGRAPTRDDLQADHAYNTYRNRGLPPGPIGSPGRAAIDAVLDPADVPYLYFVAIDDRAHHFSTTLEEHNQAVARYRLYRARRVLRWWWSQQVRHRWRRGLHPRGL